MSSNLMGYIQAGSTLALVCITIWYARTTGKMLSFMKQDTAAHIYLRLTLNFRDVYLWIINTGNKPARNLTISLPDDEYGIKPIKLRSLQELPFLKNSIRYLPPGEKYRYRVGNLDVEFVEANLPIMRFSLNYKNGFKSVSDTVEIKLVDYLHILQKSFVDPLDGIIHALRGIQSEIQVNNSAQVVDWDRSRTKCPVCGELIKGDARKCRYCLEWLPEKSEE